MLANKNLKLAVLNSQGKPTNAAQCSSSIFSGAVQSSISKALAVYGSVIVLELSLHFYFLLVNLYETSEDILFLLKGT